MVCPCLCLMEFVSTFVISKRCDDCVICDNGWQVALEGGMDACWHRSSYCVPKSVDDVNRARIVSVSC